jgi:cation:H+ antiporter
MTETAAQPGRQLVWIVTAVLAAIPGLAVRFGDYHLARWFEAVLFGLAVVGAAFMLAWAAEVIQLDVSAGLALALFALIAVLPEYAVDFVFTKEAGNVFQSTGSCVADGDRANACQLALANMTGSNQLLVGVGWSAVVLLAAWRVMRLRRRDGLDPTDPLHTGVRGDFELERSHSVEIAFLALACGYGLTLPFRHSLGLIDAAVLVSIFVGYVVRIAKAPAEVPHLIGPAQLIGSLPTVRRRIAVGLLFVGAAAIIVALAEHFADALVATGQEVGISEFLLVKWIAPLASEAPELFVALLFAWRLNTNAALGALVSSKLNQWTLLVGTLPVVFAISSGGIHGLPLDTTQRLELFVTGAQTVFAIAVLSSRSISVREAQMLLGIFVVQFVLQGVFQNNPDADHVSRLVVGVVYLGLAAIVLVKERGQIRHLLRDGLRTPYAEMTALDTSITIR